MKMKVDVSARVKLDAYKIISESIEASVEIGWKRAHKHVESPSSDHIKDEIIHSIMNNLCEILKFDDT